MQGSVAWQKLHLEYSPRTLARAMMTMVEAIAPPKVSQLKDYETSVRAWEEKLRLLERDFDERISPKLRMAILTSMCPASIQDWIYQQGESLGEFAGMLERTRTLVRNRLGLGSQKQVGGDRGVPPVRRVRGGVVLRNGRRLHRHVLQVRGPGPLRARLPF